MKTKNTGFVLIEVIVSIVVLASVLAGATSLIWAAANAVERNQNRLTGTYLAQECLEVARNARDSAWRQHLPWDCGFESSPLSACDEIALPIQLIANEGLIEILTDQTKFSRDITFDTSVLEEISVTCHVSWPRRSGTEHIYLDEILTNWRKI